MDYFYTPPEKVGADDLTIEGKEFTHLNHVMRKKAGDDLVVVDGLGNSFAVKIREIRQREAHCVILSRAFRMNEPPIRLVLAVGLLKNSGRFDFIVEKSAEIGVTSIVPLRTKRTIPQKGKIERWRSIALSAMKQSCRSVLPAVSDVVDLAEFIRRPTEETTKLIAHESASSGLRPSRVPTEKREMVVCIGPEGGFEEEEIDAAVQEGFGVLYLGARRLRTETAAVTAAAVLLAEDR